MTHTVIAIQIQVHTVQYNTITEQNLADFGASVDTVSSSFGGWVGSVAGILMINSWRSFFQLLQGS